MRIRSKLVMVLGIWLLCLAFGLAGTYIEEQVHTDAMQVMGKSQPAKDLVRKIWIDENKMANDDGSRGVIVLYDQKKMIFVDHEQKTYSVTSLPMQMPPEMQQMMKMFQFKFDVQKTGQTKKIKDWNCQEVVMTLSGFMTLKITMWCTSDIPLPFENYYKMGAEMVAYSPAMKQMMDKMATLGNIFPIQEEITGEVMGAKTHTVINVVKAEQMAIPATVFAPPAGYTEKPFDLKGMMQKQN